MTTNILCFGDSITWGASDTQGGWVERLKQYLDSKSTDENTYLVYNLGIPGDKSTPLLSRFENEITARIEEGEKTLLFLAVGINDSQYWIEEKRLTIEKEEFMQSMQTLLDIAQKYATHVVVLGLTWVDEAKVYPNPDKLSYGYKNHYIEVYNQILMHLAEENKAHFIDFQSVFTQEAFALLLDDGLHPNTRGHEALFEVIKQNLEEKKIL